jgi:hypothetical protein
MSYCRFCGKELVDGQCNCPEFQASIGNTGNMGYDGNIQNQNAYQQTKEPFIIPSFQIDFSSFSGFVSSVRDQSGMSEAISNNGDPYEHNVPIVPDCIEPEDNEIVVKQYNIAKLRTRLKFMKAEGRLMVTNRRVVFRATGTSLTGNIAQQHQFNLDEIGGIEIHKDYKFSILSFLGCLLLDFFALALTTMIFARTGSGSAIAIGIILGILAMLPTFIVYKHFWLKSFCAIIGSGCFSIAFAASQGNKFLGVLMVLVTLIVLMDFLIICFVPNLVIKIKTKGAEGAVVIGSQKSIFRRKTGDDYSGFAEVMPWEDTIMAMNELGTMIDDLQKQGDYAIQKWA